MHLVWTSMRQSPWSSFMCCWPFTNNIHELLCSVRDPNWIPTSHHQSQCGLGGLPLHDGIVEDVVFSAASWWLSALLRADKEPIWQKVSFSPTFQQGSCEQCGRRDIQLPTQLFTCLTAIFLKQRRHEANLPHLLGHFEYLLPTSWWFELKEHSHLDLSTEAHGFYWWMASSTWNLMMVPTSDWCEWLPHGSPYQIHTRSETGYLIYILHCRKVWLCQYIVIL